MERCDFCGKSIDTEDTNSEKYHCFSNQYYHDGCKVNKYYLICESCTVRILARSVELAHEIVANKGGLNLDPTGTMVIRDKSEEL